MVFIFYQELFMIRRRQKNVCIRNQCAQLHGLGLTPQVWCRCTISNYLNLAITCRLSVWSENWHIEGGWYSVCIANTTTLCRLEANLLILDLFKITRRSSWWSSSPSRPAGLFARLSNYCAPILIRFKFRVRNANLFFQEGSDIIDNDDRRLV